MLLFTAGLAYGEWVTNGCGEEEVYDNGDGTATVCTKTWQVNQDFAYYNCGGLSTSKDCNECYDPEAETCGTPQ